MMTRNTVWERLALNTFATFRYSFLHSLAPVTVLYRIVNTENRNTRNALDWKPMPNHRINSGRIATFGTAMIAEQNTFMYFSDTGNKVQISPTAIPTTTADR